jgi:hypothetical protein
MIRAGQLLIHSKTVDFNPMRGYCHESYFTEGLNSHEPLLIPAYSPSPAQWGPSRFGEDCKSGSGADKLVLIVPKRLLLNQRIGSESALVFVTVERGAHEYPNGVSRGSLR